MLGCNNAKTYACVNWLSCCKECKNICINLKTTFSEMHTEKKTYCKNLCKPTKFFPDAALILIVEMRYF